MIKAKYGDKVKVHYTGKLKDGSVFDSTHEKEPIEFKIGDGNLIQGFENAVIDMETGQSKTEKVPFEVAFGEVNKQLIFELKKDQLPGHLDPKEGDQLEIKQEKGNNVPVVVKKVTNDMVTIDANHPLAGKDLIFDLELVEVLGKK